MQVVRHRLHYRHRYILAAVHRHLVATATPQSGIYMLMRRRFRREALRDGLTNGHSAIAAEFSQHKDTRNVLAEACQILPQGHGAPVGICIEARKLCGQGYGAGRRKTAISKA
jgi:hypothetical protein